MLRMNKLPFKLRLIWEIGLKTLIIIIIAGAAENEIRSPDFFLLPVIFNFNPPFARCGIIICSQHPVLKMDFAL